jgi:hypothetical protein
MFESKINRGRANGYAPLDSGSKVPLSYLPPIQSTIDTGSFATTSSLQTLIDVTGSFATTSSLQTFSESIDGRITYLENWSSSLTDTFATDLEVSIVSSSVAATIGIVSSAVGLVTTSSFNDYTASQSTGSLVDRLNSIENATSSYELKGSGILSGSISYTDLTNIPDGIVSQSTDLSSLNSKTGSYATTGSNSFNGNQQITGSLSISVSTGIPSGVSNWNGQGGWNQGFYSAITASGGTGTGLTLDVAAGGSGYISIEQITINTPGSGYTNGDIITIDNENNLPGSFTLVVGANNFEFNTSGSLVFPDSTIQTTAFIPTTFISTSSFNEYTASQSTSSLVDRLNTIESETGSYLTNLNGTISGSSQLTSSFDTRYILSGSLTAGSNVSVSDTAPTSPTEGDLWWKSDDGNLYVYYDSYWVVATDTISAIPNGVISGSSQLTSSFDTRYLNTGGDGVISGSAQLTTSFPSKTTGTWSVPAGASTQSLSVEANSSYSMWVNGNIPNGIITWNATATISNTNVPVVGAQYGWYYAVGNAIVLTAMPDQFVGTNGSILTSPGSYAPNTSNVFKFGITNNSGATQTINYGYIKLS